MDLTLLDLSPYYLLEARKNLKYWAEKKARGESLGGSDGTGCSFLQAPAEAIPQPDASFDVVRCARSALSSLIALSISPAFH